jgi:hypothetical protein
MDRVILVSLSTGMLLFHERYNGEDETDIDEMQLASYFSALFHVRTEMKLEMQSFDPPVSLFQEVQILKFSISQQSMLIIMNKILLGFLNMGNKFDQARAISLLDWSLRKVF